ncbi:diablo, IAP-binding mitochondrial protein a isoform X3 [Amia ocellicauda]|uniref:diablo, IAP-binding mitochondrial protein a isoform X3 n=1 Tax=Amia ocellicauda TaxID=2972642 RepID=UPI003464DD1E
MYNFNVLRTASIVKQYSLHIQRRRWSNALYFRLCQRVLAVIHALKGWCSWSVIIASRQRLARFPVLVKSNCLSFGAGGGLCAVPFSQHAESLSHETLIKRASSLVTDGANTYLSQTTLALVDALTQYAKMNDKLDNCKRFQSNWMNAVNLSELAAEAAYNAGADQASVTARTNIQLAQAQVEDVRRLSLEAEMKLAEVKVEEIKRTAEYATSEKAGEDVIVEEEVPDAYLRED